MRWTFYTLELLSPDLFSNVFADPLGHRQFKDLTLLRFFRLRTTTFKSNLQTEWFPTWFDLSLVLVACNPSCPVTLPPVTGQSLKGDHSLLPCPTPGLSDRLIVFVNTRINSRQTQLAMGRRFRDCQLERVRRRTMSPDEWPSDDLIGHLCEYRWARIALRSGIRKYLRQPLPDG